MKNSFRKLKFATLGILISFQVNAGELMRNISGQVKSEGAVVPFVAVYIKGSPQGTTTDEKGIFHISIPYNQDVSLNIKGIGYKTTSYNLSYADNKDFFTIEIEPEIQLLQQVVVSGSRVGVLRYLPGSVAIVRNDDLRKAQPISGNEILRSIPGVHVVEEEGAGLRANIGIRGLDPDKSRNVLILEDGIPVALAPYGEPEMYFTPNIDRMSGIEILKGNGSILFGPQTIGGVINYITADPPQESTGNISFRGGDLGYFNSRITHGNTLNRTGYYIDFTRKQAENFGPTQFLLHDLNTKLQTDLSPISQLGFKLSIYDEVSNSTYVGLTQPMYEAGSMDDLRIAPDDILKIRRYAASINHKYQLADGFQLNTTAFAYTTTRNWNRQDFTYSSSASNLTGQMHGFPDNRDGAIFMRNSTGQRNRQFEVAGIEPRLHYKYNIGSTNAYMDAGLRYLYERAFEQRVNGTSAGVMSGDLRDDEIRTGNAFSTYLQNKFMINTQLSFTAGLRSELIGYEREIMRRNFKDTLIVAQSSVFEIIPGAGLNYNFTDNLGIFAGIHRGFAPPRTKDAISNEGADLQLEAEKSWNMEMGIRGNLRAVEFELTAFHMDFSNQVIPVSESSGGAGTGYINGGKTVHTGLETSFLLPFGHILPENWNAGFLWNATWVNAKFSGDRYVLFKSSLNSENENVYQNVKGNRTPYSPSLSFSGAFQLETPFGLGFRISGNYVGSQYTDVLNTENVYDWININAQDTDYRYAQATANGRIGKLDPYFVTNMHIWYRLGGSGLEFSLSIKNLTNERYIASRRPQGIRVGLPRFISAGISYGF
ncbi:MAG: TonB-dependent receptor [Bacteroidetes bacterium]|nr:MAG: TonB-dependent receptor [Bacteroidota bacterium]